MSSISAQPEVSPAARQPKLQRQFVSFVVYSVDPVWRRLPSSERQAGKEQFAKVIERYSQEKLAQILTYTTMGMRAEGDMLLWIIAYELDTIQKLASELAATGLGQYLHKGHSFLAMTKRSMYLDRYNPEHPEDRKQHPDAGKSGNKIFCKAVVVESGRPSRENEQNRKSKEPKLDRLNFRHNIPLLPAAPARFANAASPGCV